MNDLDELIASIPDIDSLIVDNRTTNTAGHSSFYHRQKLQTAVILSRARAMVNENGISSFNVRRLASYCKVSPQTIYNLIGDRDHLLSSAIGQHAEALVTLAYSLEGYPNVLLAFADVGWANAMKNPAYSRSVTLTQFLLRGKSSSTTHAIMRKTFYKVLRDMQAFRQIRVGVDINLLVESMHSHIGFAGLDWIENNIDDAQLRRRLCMDIGYLLLGSMNMAAQREVSIWIDRFLANQGTRPDSCV